MIIILGALTLVILVTAVFYFIYKSKAAKTTLLILVGVFIILLAIFFFSPAAFLYFFDSAVDKKAAEFNDSIPINPFLSKTLAAVLVAINVFAWGYIFSTSSRKRNIGVLAFVGSFIAFQLICYFVIRNQIFPNKRCASNLMGGYEYVDANLKTDPNYNTPVCDCTPEMILAISGKATPSVSRVTISAETTFFTYDGKPLIWYYQYDDGRLEFFNHGGTHPQFGVPLKPVTREVVMQALNYLNHNQQNMLVTDKSAAPPKVLSGPPNPVKGAKSKSVSTVEVTYLNSGAKNINGVIVEVLEQGNSISNPLSASIAALYTEKGHAATTGLMSSGFLRASGTHELFDGDLTAVNKYKLAQYAKYLALGKLDLAFTPGSESAGTVVCTASLTVNVISTQSPSLLQSFTITDAIGNGVTDSQAKDAAIRKLLIKYSNEHTTL